MSPPLKQLSLIDRIVTESRDRSVTVISDDRKTLEELVESYDFGDRAAFVHLDGSRLVCSRVVPRGREKPDELVGQDDAIRCSSSLAAILEAELASVLTEAGIGNSFDSYKAICRNWMLSRLRSHALYSELLLRLELDPSKSSVMLLCNPLSHANLARMLAYRSIRHIRLSPSVASTSPARWRVPVGWPSITVRSYQTNISSGVRLELHLPIDPRFMTSLAEIYHRARRWRGRMAAIPPTHNSLADLRTVFESPVAAPTFGKTASDCIMVMLGSNKLHLATLNGIWSSEPFTTQSSRIQSLSILDMTPAGSFAGREALLKHVPLALRSKTSFYSTGEFSLDSQQVSVLWRSLRVLKSKLCSDGKERSATDRCEKLRRHDLTSEIIETVLFELFTRVLPLALSVRAELTRIFRLPGRRVLLSCTDSYWLGDVARLAAVEAGQTRITVQNAYMSQSPRYKAPQGDIFTVIDAWSRDLMIRHFGISPEVIQLVGTPRFDSLAGLATSPTVDVEVELKSLAGAQAGQPVVCFAAQPENLSVSAARIARLLAGVRSDRSPLNIVIKLHPTASKEFQEELASYCSSLRTQHALLVVSGFDIHKLLQMSELLITVSSNVGIEAAILDKDILIANLEGRELSPPLDKFEIGINATDDSSFVAGVEGILNNPDVRAALRIKRQRYRTENAHLIVGQSGQRIAALIEQALTADE